LGTSRACRDLDLIVSNPPYIGHAEKEGLQREIRDHEPATALYAGDQGTDIYAPLIRDSAARLKAGGILVLELGYHSMAMVRPLLKNSDWAHLAITNDLAGIPRVLAAERL
jgi:release factor glutamine methyltransferase